MKCYFCDKEIEEDDPTDVSEYIDGIDEGSYAHSDCWEHACIVPGKSDFMPDTEFEAVHLR